MVSKPKTNIEKETNLENLCKAEIICANRLNKLNKQQIYTPFEQERLRLIEIGEKSFLQYLKQIAESKTGINSDNWRYAITHFEMFLKNEDLLMREIDVTVIEDFREYILNAKGLRRKNQFLAQNTALSYFNKIKATLKKAHKLQKKTPKSFDFGVFKMLWAMRGPNHKSYISFKIFTFYIIKIRIQHRQTLNTLLNSRLSFLILNYPNRKYTLLQEQDQIDSSLLYF